MDEKTRADLECPGPIVSLVHYIGDVIQECISLVGGHVTDDNETDSMSFDGDYEISIKKKE